MERRFSKLHKFDEANSKALKPVKFKTIMAVCAPLGAKTLNEGVRIFENSIYRVTK